MAQSLVNVGTVANDGTGDPLRTAFGKVNSNDTELYSLVNLSVVPVTAAPTVTTASNGKLYLASYDATDDMTLPADVTGACSFAVAWIGDTAPSFLCASGATLLSSTSDLTTAQTGSVSIQNGIATFLLIEATGSAATWLIVGDVGV